MNDWDLSHRTGENHDGGERNGTLPFMALDLLDEKAVAGEKKRLYRHDLEGLIWILPWVFLQYENGRLVHPVLSAWCAGDHATCLAHRSHFLRMIADVEPLPLWIIEWNMAFEALVWVHNHYQAQEDHASFSNKRNHTSGPFPEPHPKDVYHSFLRQLLDAWG